MSIKLSKTIHCNQRIKYIRTQLGFTQEAFAEQLDISYSAYKKLESGENLPSIETLCKFKNRFHISSDYILFGELNSADDTWEQFLNSSAHDQMELHYRIQYYVTHFQKISVLSEEEQQEITKYIQEIYPTL